MVSHTIFLRPHPSDSSPSPAELINMICRLTTDTLQDQRSSHTPPQTSPEPIVGILQRETLSDPNGDQKHGDQKHGNKPTETKKIGGSRSTEQILGSNPNHLKISRTVSNNVPTRTEDVNGGQIRRGVSPVSIPFYLSPPDISMAGAQTRPPADSRGIGGKHSVGSMDVTGNKHHPLRQSRSHMSNSSAMMGTSNSSANTPQFFPDAYGNTLDRKPTGPTPQSYASQERLQLRPTNASVGSQLQAKGGSIPINRPYHATQSVYGGRAHYEGQVSHQKQQSWPSAVPGGGGGFTSSQTSISRGPPAISHEGHGHAMNYPYPKAQSRRYISTSSTSSLPPYYLHFFLIPPHLILPPHLLIPPLLTLPPHSSSSLHTPHPPSTLLILPPHNCLSPPPPPDLNISGSLQLEIPPQTT